MTVARSGAEDNVLARQEDLDEQREIDARIMNSMTDREAKQTDWRNKIATSNARRQTRTYNQMVGADTEEELEEERNVLSEFVSSSEAEVEEVSDETPVIEEVASEEEATDTDGGMLITKTIDGRKVTRSVDEWIAIASKVDDADKYYAAAVNRQREESKPAVKTTDVRDLARKLQLGSEDEAAEALTEVLNTAVTKVKAEKKEADVQEAGKAIYQSFTKDYADIINDPVLNSALNNMDQQLMNQEFDSDPVVNFDKRLRHCGEQIRAWRNNVADTSVKTAKRQDLVNKKSQIVNLNTASQKQGSKSAAVLSERQAKEQAVANMFATRKKRAF